ncbi:MAG TPA: hypothetical protein VIM26_24495 [Pengzhenrongella sp.]
MGERAKSSASTSGLASTSRSIIEVRIGPGHTAFTRMPIDPYSRAATLEMPTTPNFDAL